MLAIVISLGVLIFAFANGSTHTLSENYALGMSQRQTAAAQKFEVAQVAYDFPIVGLDGASTNQMAGSSSSISTTLSTLNSNDLVMAYVSPADSGTSTPPIVSGISGGGLTWHHRASTAAETYNKYYVPITLTNNQPAPPSIDGTASKTFSGTNSGTTPTLTTTKTNDVIVVLASAEDLVHSRLPSVSSVTATGLTFSHRSTETATTDLYLDEEVWYAVATSAFSGTITVTFTDSRTLDDAAVVAFGVANTNTASPWDSNVALPAVNTAASATAPTLSTLSTSNANDMVVGFSAMMSQAAGGNPTQTAGSGYTLILNAINGGGTYNDEASAEYAVVNVVQSGATVNFGTSASGTEPATGWNMVGDAIQGAGAATPNPFQQMVTWNPSSYSAYEGGSLGNIRFCSDAYCVAPLYSWLESCTPSCTTGATSATAWVLLQSSINNGGGTLTIYMVFDPTSVTFDGVYWGEAPNLSATYGQYDNGAYVFTDYFNGNTPVSSFSVYTGYALSQATGITGPGGATINALEATGYNGGNPVFAHDTALSNTALVVESSFSSPGSTTVSPYAGTDTGAAGLVDNSVATSVANGISADMGYGAVYFNQDYETGGTYTADQNPQGTATANWVYATLTYTGPGAASWTAFIAPQLYSSTGGYSGTVTGNPLNAATNLYLGQLSDTATGNTLTVYYNFMRARVYPPGGAMPAVALGAVTNAGPTFDLEEWYAASSSPLSSATITATLSSADTSATWIAVFGLSNANTASPFDPNVSVPATSSGTTPSTTISTTGANDLLLFGCAAYAGGVPLGFTGLYSNSFSDEQGEFLAYQSVTSTQSSLSTSCGTNSYGAQISDAVVAAPGGADVYVRNVGSVPTTLVSIYLTDLTSGTPVLQTTLSTAVNVGSFAEIPHATLSFTPVEYHTYSFTVSSSMGDSAVYTLEAT
jgi:hypothetical protein